MNVTMSAAVNESEVCNVTLSSADISTISTSSYERCITVLETSIIAVVSSGIILSNIVNLIAVSYTHLTLPTKRIV